jgi:Holliday junction DNA helicase RuvA
MIEYLSGRLIEKSPTHVVVLCGGVGYGAMISLATFERLPDVGRDAALYAQLVVREDSLTLYAFASTAEREMFGHLISVTGIGPKTAMGVLSSVGIDTLRENIARGNAVALTALPGIGRKTAERIGVELRDKIAASGGPSLPGVAAGAADVRGEALAALMALGYSRPAAEKALRGSVKAGAESELSLEEMIKAALKHVAD